MWGKKFDGHIFRLFGHNRGKWQSKKDTACLWLFHIKPLNFFFQHTLCLFSLTFQSIAEKLDGMGKLRLSESLEYGPEHVILKFLEFSAQDFQQDSWLTWTIAGCDWPEILLTRTELRESYYGIANSDFMKYPKNV